MRKTAVVLALVLLLALGGAAAFAQGEAEAVLSFEPDFCVVETGDAFGLEVWVTLADGVAADSVAVTFTYEPTYTDVIEIVPALPSVLVNTVGDGTAELQAGVLGAENAKTGAFQLCTLHMMANQMTVLDTRVIASSIQVAHVGEDVPAVGYVADVRVVNPPAYVSIDFPLPFIIPYQLADMTYYADSMVLVADLPESGPVTITITSNVVTVESNSAVVEYR